MKYVRLLQNLDGLQNLLDALKELTPDAPVYLTDEIYREMLDKAKGVISHKSGRLTGFAANWSLTDSGITIDNLDVTLPTTSTSPKAPNLNITTAIIGTSPNNTFTIVLDKIEISENKDPGRPTISEIVYRIRAIERSVQDLKQQQKQDLLMDPLKEEFYATEQ